MRDIAMFVRRTVSGPGSRLIVNAALFMAVAVVALSAAETTIGPGGRVDAANPGAIGESFKPLRVITYNVHKFTGLPTDPHRDRMAMAREIGTELKKYVPDIVVFEESPNDYPEALHEMAARLGMKTVLFAMGGALFTRLPVLESHTGIRIEGDPKPEELFPEEKGKFVGRAVLSWAGQDLILYMAHLRHKADPASSALRQREITQLLRVMKDDKARGASLLVLGDMNHGPDGPEYRQWITAGYSDTFGMKGIGVAETRLYNGASKPPVKRLDYIFAAGPIVGQLVGARVLWEGRFRVEPGSAGPAYALSDHVPVIGVFRRKDVQAINTAVVPVPRGENWLRRHDAFVKAAKQGGGRVLFLGDSITDHWRKDNPAAGGKDVWDKELAPLGAVNFGISGDRTQHLLWRIKHGEIAGFRPEVVVLQIGTNNTGYEHDGMTPRNSPIEVVAGITAIVEELRSKLPEAKILLLAPFPRGEPNDPTRAQIKEISDGIAKLQDGIHVRYLDIGGHFLGVDGRILPGVMPDLVHPSRKGYEIWAAAIRGPLVTMMR